MLLKIGKINLLNLESCDIITIMYFSMKILKIKEGIFVKNNNIINYWLVIYFELVLVLGIVINRKVDKICFLYINEI